MSALRLLLIAAACCVAWAGEAISLTLADAKARNAARLSLADLRQLMPGAKVVSHAEQGDTRVWQNKANGTLVASTDSWDGSSFGRDVLSGAAHGTWGIGEEGSYCVSIQWSSSEEDWCRYIFQLGDRYYGFTTLEQNAVGSEFEISK
jgi:hypothetical protein